MVGVAQLVRVLDCGSRCRRFEPGHPPNKKTAWRKPGGFFLPAWTVYCHKRAEKRRWRLQSNQVVLFVEVSPFTAHEATKWLSNKAQLLFSKPNSIQHPGDAGVFNVCCACP